MKYDPAQHTLSFASDEEVKRFHWELTALLREVVTEASRHGDRDEGKAAAQSVFKDCPTVLRALNAFRRHLERNADPQDDEPPR
jgi:hypothetical protein